MTIMRTINVPLKPADLRASAISYQEEPDRRNQLSNRLVNM